MWVQVKQSKPRTRRIKLRIMEVEFNLHRGSRLQRAQVISSKLFMGQGRSSLWCLRKEKKSSGPWNFCSKLNLLPLGQLSRLTSRVSFLMKVILWVLGRSCCSQKLKARFKSFQTRNAQPHGLPVFLYQRTRGGTSQRQQQLQPLRPRAERPRGSWQKRPRPLTSRQAPTTTKQEDFWN